MTSIQGGMIIIMLFDKDIFVIIIDNTSWLVLN